MNLRGGGAPANNALVRVLKKIKAFTLAEVLITLGIIGIVAAMTMPIVISGYRKSVVVNSLRTNLSLFAQAVQLAEAKHGFTDDWPVCAEEYSKECTEDFFNNYLKPELKVLKVCNSENQELCWTEPKSLSGQTGYLGGTPDKMITAVLSNGASMYMWAGNQLYQDPHWQIWIDIDGPNKGRALIGGDVFGIILRYKNAILNDGTPTKKGVQLVGSEYQDENILRTNSRFACDKSITGMYAGRYCGALIQSSGWKIPNDYPVKF